MSLLCHQLLVSRGLLTFYSLHQLFSATNIAAVVIVVTDSQYVFTQSNRSNASCVFHSAIIALLTLNTRCNAPVLGFLNCQNYGCQFEGCQRLTYQKVFFISCSQSLCGYQDFHRPEPLSWYTVSVSLRQGDLGDSIRRTLDKQKVDYLATQM